MSDDRQRSLTRPLDKLANAMVFVCHCTDPRSDHNVWQGQCFNRVANPGRRKGGMARKFWQKKNTIVMIAIIFLWYNHKHEVNKQVRSSAGMIDMSDGRELCLYQPQSPRLRTGAIRHVWHMRNSATCVVRSVARNLQENPQCNLAIGHDNEQTQSALICSD